MLLRTGKFETDLVEIGEMPLSEMHNGLFLRGECQPSFNTLMKTHAPTCIPDFAVFAHLSF
jgi:hypothetical protein